MQSCSNTGQAGDVDTVVELGLRSVSGFAGFTGFTGAVLFVGEIDKVVWIGDFDPDDAGFTTDCDPSCSHCFNLSATLPVFLPSAVVGMIIGFVAVSTDVARDGSAVGAGIAVGLRTGNGGCDF